MCQKYRRDISLKIFPKNWFETSSWHYDSCSRNHVEIDSVICLNKNSRHYSFFPQFYFGNFSNFLPSSVILQEFNQCFFKNVFQLCFYGVLKMFSIVLIRFFQRFKSCIFLRISPFHLRIIPTVIPVMPQDFFFQDSLIKFFRKFPILLLNPINSSRIQQFKKFLQRRQQEFLNFSPMF